MAWLIVLALFLWIGGSICKVADHQTDKRAKKIINLWDAQREFVANLYVLGWNYYQKMEPSVLQAAKSSGIDCLFGYDLEVYSEALNGKPISQAAIEQALQDMIDRGVKMLSYNPKSTWDDSLHDKLIPVSSGQSISASDEASLWENDIKYEYASDFHLPQFNLFFDFYLAEQAKIAWIKQQIPEYDDIRVYKDSLGMTRADTPKYYEQEIKERRQLEQACADAEQQRQSL